jgi:hypothetical protein
LTGTGLTAFTGSATVIGRSRHIIVAGAHVEEFLRDGGKIHRGGTFSTLLLAGTFFAWSAFLAWRTGGFETFAFPSLRGSDFRPFRRKDVEFSGLVGFGGSRGGSAVEGKHLVGGLHGNPGSCRGANDGSGCDRD